ncbi:MAG: hypothetical protein P8R54_25200 [Myxococcota bacterium]|nr:hypothetical protein [Myxococcota bacterium]
MNKTTLAAALLLGTGCDNHDDDHAHGHGHTEPHEEPATAHAGSDHDAPAATPTAAGAPLEATLGADTLRLTPTADHLILALFDASGGPVAPEGEVRVVLTPTDGEEQRIVLTPDGGGWSGAASVAGASGYVAVVSLTHNGQPQTARIAWGDAPIAPADAPEEAEEDHQDGDHDHGHGH